MTNPPNQKKPVPQDWHPADVVAGLRKVGWSLAQLGYEHGYKKGALQIALRKPYPRAERIIAAALNVPPQAIWPSRYNPDGTTNRPFGRPIRPAWLPAKPTTVAAPCNLQQRRAG